MCVGNKKSVRVQRPPSAFKPQTGPSSAVELSISARDLVSKDTFSKSDPMCVVYRNHPQGIQEIGRTEQIQNSHNPTFGQKIRVDYYFETKQPLLFRLFDIDSNSPDLSKQDFLGEAECDLAEIVSTVDGQLPLKLLNRGKVSKGNLILHAEQIEEGNRQMILFKIQGVNLAKKSFFRSCNPFLEFYGFSRDGRRNMVFRSPVCRGNVNPDFAIFEMSVQSLCGNNFDQEFQIDCLSHNSSGSHKLIGSCRTTINQLNGKPNVYLPLEKNGQQVGTEERSLRIQQISLRKEHTFIEFAAGGLQLEFAVCVDLTDSNGPVYNPDSLHYLGPYPTQYELAIRAVLEICEHYNHTRNFDAMGFGARIPPMYETAHLFPLSLTPHIREAHGVEGVIQAYKQCLTIVQFSGPTNFEPAIREYANKTSMFPKDGTRFQILLIITDGVITDMAKTRTAIVQASTLPLAIIIIGVGNEDFAEMDALDSDTGLLTDHNGFVAKRDIVQFVPFRQVMPNPTVNLSEAEREAVMFNLAKRVLAEVPGQVTSYMKMMGIEPRPPLVAAKSRHSDEKKD
ncbi:C2 domain protein [Aphelenchoides besseyi]|nr:C2 domain protein [Aphelenchoides besseyi]KAI6195123.1 C2 domain protein [Aphelenchoides besseyi]